MTLAELDEIVSARPSLRGFLFGYLNEYKLRRMWFSGSQIRDIVLYDNHDRRHKGDMSFTYKGVPVAVECKALQTSTVRQVNGQYSGKFQCDASDRRKVHLPGGEELETTCLVVGEFDLLAVGLFEFGQQWRFAFAANSDLPRSKYSRYTPEQRRRLLAATMAITWPLCAPFRDEPFAVLDAIVRRKKNRAHG